MTAGEVPTFRRFRNWPTCQSAGASAGHSNRTKTRRKTEEMTAEIPFFVKKAHIAVDRTSALTHPPPPPPPPLTSPRCLFNPERTQQVPAAYRRPDMKAALFLNGHFLKENRNITCRSPFCSEPPLFLLLFPPADFIKATPPRLRVTNQDTQLLLCCVRVCSEKSH